MQTLLFSLAMNTCWKENLVPLKHFLCYYYSITLCYACIACDTTKKSSKNFFILLPVDLATFSDDNQSKVQIIQKCIVSGLLRTFQKFDLWHFRFCPKTDFPVNLRRILNAGHFWKCSKFSKNALRFRVIQTFWEIQGNFDILNFVKMADFLIILGTIFQTTLKTDLLY